MTIQVPGIFYSFYVFYREGVEAWLFLYLLSELFHGYRAAPKSKQSFSLLAKNNILLVTIHCYCTLSITHPKTAFRFHYLQSNNHSQRRFQHRANHNNHNHHLEKADDNILLMCYGAGCLVKKWRKKFKSWNPKQLLSNLSCSLGRIKPCPNHNNHHHHVSSKSRRLMHCGAGCLGSGPADCFGRCWTGVTATTITRKHAAARGNNGINGKD